VWDPWLIIAQIISLQCLFYMSLGLWQMLFVGPYIGRLTVAQIFGWQALSFRTYVGVMTMVSNLATSVTGALFIMWIVERAKKCLDFASTCYIWHLVFCCIHSGFPMSLEWWATNSLGLLIMSLLGEWLCVRREMQDIPLASVRNARRGSGPSGSAGTSDGVQMTAAGGVSSSSSSAPPALRGVSATGLSSTAPARVTSSTRLLSGQEAV